MRNYRLGVDRVLAGGALALTLGGGAGAWAATPTVIGPTDVIAYITFNHEPWTREGTAGYGAVSHGVVYGLAEEERTEMEFDLSGVAGGGYTATLRPYNDLAVSPTVGGAPITVNVYGFIGTGTSDVSFAENLGSYLGTFGPTSGVGYYSLDVSDFVNAELAAGGRYAGFVLTTNTPGGAIEPTMQSELVVTSLAGGDANGDGRVDADDYALIDRGFARQLAGWANGDFNRDGSVGGDDYVIIDAAYEAAHGPLSPGVLAGREAAFGAGYAAELAAAVPEPAGVGVLLVGAMALRRRRR